MPATANPDTPRIDRLDVTVGGLSRSQLASALNERGILLNAHAETLLEHDVFDSSTAQTVTVTERTVAELGFTDGATLSQILGASQHQNLVLCPAETGPYLRLALTEQPASADSVMSSGRAPAGSLTMATAALSDDDEYPKGFYLRVVDDAAWLRGYRCDDEHVWSPDDRFLFRLPEMD